MRIDVITIFPEYLDALRLSLVGRSVDRGIIDLRVHSLRDYTHDVHRTVDDTPYGGGAGMVMRPEPWGEAFDDVLAGADDPLVLFTTPAGAVFTQQRAVELSHERHIVFCCGRYEGIDQRVVDYAAAHWRTGEISIGDYVLNGGEVAVLVVVEAVARLLPGVIGNPESLVEESHNRGLLEHPSYTKPAEWRGLEVPAVLLSGNHRLVAEWQHEQSVSRTRSMRPDLLP
ncbi:tRNA (guanosine(37)-N1)-methyltransferase TrmD [Pseudoclavibacter sp. 13-3]|uniref:tRNA (guanosine(37)-N1)-methyltransferase TrmD n=1 Tax=Pseudoclavibacter sp. 13-3 TaxID=2901228 RepID=UPI001E31408E|nr:tRNA (guanosine(37)-N1)-methyltransferase TrmD [Pseudoclavibacter sp. 13-3]MCD7100890.1 tRNA (guanosine(37)-N1)-methyltransferase TrmD [Pseudoclavibacter sp. 13-3]